jgi:hypothetical protein
VHEQGAADLQTRKTGSNMKPIRYSIAGVCIFLAYVFLIIAEVISGKKLIDP